MQIPGHKNQYGGHTPTFAADLLGEIVRDDIALQGGVDDNALSNHYLEDAEALWARSVGADHARFLVGGSTQGNIAALCAVTRPGHAVAVDRTSHRSVQSALVISGARPVWLLPQMSTEFGLPTGISVAAASRRSPDITAIFVTSPSYVGTHSDIAGLATLAHEVHAPLVVDQAWGAHLDFMAGLGGLAQGADASVTSVHKILMGYSQTAVVSWRDGRVDQSHFNRCIDLAATTSPSGTLLASIDATRAALDRDGSNVLERTAQLVADVRRRLAVVRGLVVLDDDKVPNGVEPFKITLWLPGTGVSGLELARTLSERGQGAETADLHTLVMTVSPVDEPEFVHEVVGFVIGQIERLRSAPRIWEPSAVWTLEPEVVLTPRDAFFAKRRRIELRYAIGQVSAEQFCPYPPGIPLLAPGERITEGVVEGIRQAAEVGRVAYMSDASLRTVEVVEDLPG